MVPNYPYKTKASGYKVDPLYLSIKYSSAVLMLHQTVKQAGEYGNKYALFIETERPNQNTEYKVTLQSAIVLG